VRPTQFGRSLTLFQKDSAETSMHLPGIKRHAWPSGRIARVRSRLKPALEFASFGFGITIILLVISALNSATAARLSQKLMPIYDQTLAHCFFRMLDPRNDPAAGDPKPGAARAIEKVGVEPAPLRAGARLNDDLSKHLIL
jgi:hypothetical protein